MNFCWNKLAEHRANQIVVRLLPHLPAVGRVLDVGSGTGHNAVALRASADVECLEADVVDMHVVGTGPTLFNGHCLKFGDGEFASSLLLFVLHYPNDPLQLLREIRRVTTGRVLILQSTYRGRVGLAILKLREFVLGRFAFRLARVTQFIDAVPCPLKPQRYWTREDVIELGNRAALTLREIVPERPSSRLTGSRFISRDLFVWELPPS